MQHSQVDKVSTLLERGFDPNYQDAETGGEADVRTRMLTCIFCPLSVAPDDRQEVHGLDQEPLGGSESPPKDTYEHKSELT